MGQVLNAFNVTQFAGQRLAVSAGKNTRILAAGGKL